MTPADQARTARPVLPWLPTMLGLAGVLILFAVLMHLAVRRYGGWRVVTLALHAEIELTVARITAPARSRRRHRRHLRLLTELLSDPDGWVIAEQAMLRAEAVSPGLQAYAALLGWDVVGVLVSGGPGGLPAPGEPWVVDEDDPGLWWIDRTDAAGTAPASYAISLRPTPPLLVALGTDIEYEVLAVLLDLVRGPATLSIGGEPGTARAVLQSIAAQLDARLPARALMVADGVHDHYRGPDPVTAIAAAEHHAAISGEPTFAVCATLPGGRRSVGGARLIAGDGARGTARLVETARDGGVLVHGTPLCADAFALPAAVAEIFGQFPPYPTPGNLAGDLEEPKRTDPARSSRTAAGPTPGYPAAQEPAARRTTLRPPPTTPTGKAPGGTTPVSKAQGAHLEGPLEPHRHHR
ncbi:hypothetical protein AB0K60_19780 [Thermopolyspora sp. NPDC052614]|uniref:hypothetical protein n=1 Tax=Thermopolyspora sp. NPDC052614 TaxID=3155682 RepID=UPI0034499385